MISQSFFRVTQHFIVFFFCAFKIFAQSITIRIEHFKVLMIDTAPNNILIIISISQFWSMFQWKQKLVYWLLIFLIVDFLHPWFVGILSWENCEAEIFSLISIFAGSLQEWWFVFAPSYNYKNVFYKIHVRIFFLVFLLKQVDTE